MTHSDNLEQILKTGGLLSKNNLLNKQITSKDISNTSVQDGRANIVVDATGLSIHDYVPLYWGNKTPMVSAVREHNRYLLFLRFSPNLLENYDCVLTEGNARSAGTLFRHYTHLSDLDFLDVAAINTGKYAYSDEVKRKKQAEVLVLNFLPLVHLHHIICPSDVVKNTVDSLLSVYGIKVNTYIGKGNFYYY